MNRIFFDKYDSSGKFPDKRVKLDIYFRSSDGKKYVWTPDWERGTRNFFLEAYRIEKLNVPKSSEVKQFKRTAMEVLSDDEQEEDPTNYKLVGMTLGEGLKYETSVNQINRAASIIFNFAYVSHNIDSITSVRSQTIYDWVMSLSKQPISVNKKLKLLRQFINALTSEDSPLRKLIDS